MRLAKPPKKNTPMAEEQNSSSAAGDIITYEPQNPNPFLSFFSNLLNFLKSNLPPLPFLPPQRNQRLDGSSDAVSDSKKLTGDAPKEEETPTGFVSYPRQEFAPVKLEAEDVGASETKPVNLWMAYAIGGYLVATWAWTRWNERRSRKKPSDDRPPPSAE